MQITKTFAGRGRVLTAANGREAQRVRAGGAAGSDPDRARHAQRGAAGRRPRRPGSDPIARKPVPGHLDRLHLPAFNLIPTLSAQGNVETGQAPALRAIRRETAAGHHVQQRLHARSRTQGDGGTVNDEHQFPGTDDQSNGPLSVLARLAPPVVRVKRTKYGPCFLGRGIHISRVPVSSAVVASRR